MAQAKIKDRLLSFYKRFEVLLSLGFFALGFLFDLHSLGNIDDIPNLIKQGIYLFVLGTLIFFEIRVKTGTFRFSPAGQKLWQYHDLVVHFFFGTLLRAYTIFYYTSASAITGLIFIALLAVLMLANEIPSIKRLGLPVRVILFSICSLSYFIYFYPIILGRIGATPFWLGFMSSLTLLLVASYLSGRGSVSNRILRKQVLLPAILVHFLFLFAYYTSFIPPVPVAVKKIGVYYQITKSKGVYKGHHQRGFWNRIRLKTQDFPVRPGDKIHVLLAIYSPQNFKDQVILKWYYEESAGWVLKDTIPITILGGRKEGFRGYAVKAFYRIGSWKVLVESSDGREMGRVFVNIQEDRSSGERKFKTDRF